mgnify:CR=1 FL=1
MMLPRTGTSLMRLLASVDLHAHVERGLDAERARIAKEKNVRFAGSPKREVLALERVPPVANEVEVGFPFESQMRAREADQTDRARDVRPELHVHVVLRHRIFGYDIEALNHRDRRGRRARVASSS